ncbi:MAG: CDP-alcohol phosphatidyltransferase family protein [Candidatus Hatepunaea meridiana]|nr:CDP-alcohol phosphatidyltransferase family protein [Candidatus Hatepunaea meridiana]
MTDSSNSSNSFRIIIKRSRAKIRSVLGSKSSNGQVTVTPANWFTLFRLVIVPFFWYCFFSGSLTLQILATFLFIAGAISDLIDGKLARRRGEVTPFGNFMDPLADKLLILSAFWALLIRENFSDLFTLALVWIALITLREVGLTLLRIWAISGGSSVVTSAWGKWKTGIQIATIIFTLLALNLRDILIYNEIASLLFKGYHFFILINFLLFLCAVSSLVSGGLYLKSVRIRVDRSD